MPDVIINLSMGKITLIGNGLSSEELKDPCPYCLQDDCYGNCDGSAGDVDGLESEEEMVDRQIYNATIDGIESLTLALLSNGALRYDDPKLKEALETSLAAAANNRA
jgi:hypothetical protein